MPLRDSTEHLIPAKTIKQQTFAAFGVLYFTKTVVKFPEAVKSIITKQGLLTTYPSCKKSVMAVNRNQLNL